MKYPEDLYRREGANIDRLTAAGIDGCDARKYFRAGVTSADDMIRYHAAGIDGHQALGYHDAGIDGDEARGYRRAGISTPADAQQWKAAGIDGYEAFEYRKAGVTTLAAAQRWKASGIDGYDAWGYHSSGVTTLDKMLRLARLGCRTLDAAVVVQPALLQSGDAVVDRVLTVGEDLNRFPAGTLRALGRASRLTEDLLAASDGDLRVAVVLAEDRYASTGEVSVPFIRQSIGIL